MKLPISVYTTVTVQDLAILNSPTDITGVAIGTSPNRPRITDVSLHKQVATYPAYATIENGELIIYTAMEYGTSLGVYELGIYAGDTLVATINQKSRYEINKPIFALRHDRTYIFGIRLSLAHIDGVRNRGALHLTIDERDDITYPMAMAIQHNAALSMVATEQVRLLQEIADLSAISDEHDETIKEHEKRLVQLDEMAALHEQAINELKTVMEANDIAKLAKELAERALGRTDELQNEVDELKIATDKAMEEAKNKVRIKSKHERLLVMHDVENNKYELTLSDVAKASNLAAEIIRRQHENARIREEIEEKIDGKLDERQVRAMIAEAELDDVTRDEIKLQLIEAVADKMTDERVTELLSHKMDVLTAERLLAQKANHEYVDSQIDTKDKELNLKLDTKVSSDELTDLLASKANKSDVPTNAKVGELLNESRLESEAKINAVNAKVDANHAQIDKLTEQQAANVVNIKGLIARLNQAPTSENIAIIKAELADLSEKMADVPNVANRIAKSYIDTLTDGASGAMDTFAEVEAALNNGDSVAAGLLNQINQLQRTIDTMQGESSQHRQFTGYKTATNLTQIVALILE